MNLKDYKMQKGNISKKSTFWTQETTQINSLDTVLQYDTVLSEVDPHLWSN